MTFEQKSERREEDGRVNIEEKAYSTESIANTSSNTRMYLELLRTSSQCG